MRQSKRHIDESVRDKHIETENNRERKMQKNERRRVREIQGEIERQNKVSDVNKRERKGEREIE